MPITGHPHNLLRRGRDYAADITSSSTIIKKSIKSLIRKTISSLSIHGPAGSGKATAVAQVLVAIDRDITNFTSVIWIESSSTTSSVGMLQHFLINQIVAQAPDLRKMTSNAEVTFAPPTTVQDGTILLSKMMSDAQLCGHSFLFILNECDNPFLPNELGLGFDQSFCILTHSRIVADICSRRIQMPQIDQDDIHSILSSYEENISILPMLAGYTEEEQVNLQDDLIMVAYKLSINRKTNQAKTKSSKAVEQAKELERVHILVEICQYPLMATMAAGSLRHAERWSKKKAAAALENFLRRIERSVQEEHGILYYDNDNEDININININANHELALEKELPRPSMGNIIDAALDSIPHLVRLCLLDLVYVHGSPKGFSYKLAIKLWSMRIGHGAPESTGDLRAFLQFLQMEEYTEELEKEGVDIKLCISANAGITEAVGKFVAWASDSGIPVEFVKRLKESVFRQCDLQDFVNARVLFGKYPSCFNVLTQLTDACLLEFDRSARTLTIHNLVRERMEKQLIHISESSNVQRDSHLRILTCLRNNCCVPDTWIPRDDDNVNQDIAGYFFRNIRRHLIGANRKKEADQLWFNFRFLLGWMSSAGVVEVVSVAARSTLDDGRLRNIVSALQSSAHALSTEPKTLATQLLGRLDIGSVAASVRGHDAGARLLQSASDFSKIHSDLTTVSASLGSIRERLRSKNVIRELSNCGEHIDPTKVCVSTRSDGEPIVVGIIHDPLDTYVVVHSLNSGSLLHKIQLKEEESQVAVVGVSPKFEYVFTSHVSGYLVVWDMRDENILIDEGIHRQFLLGLEEGHTQHVACIAFSYAEIETKQRDKVHLSKYAKIIDAPQRRVDVGPTFCVTAGHDGEIIMWDLVDRRMVKRITGTWGIIESVTFASFTTMHEVVLVSGNVLILWNLELGRSDSFKLPKDDVGTHLTTVRVSLSKTSKVRIPKVIVGFQSGMLITCSPSHPRMIHTSERIGTRTTVHRGALTSLIPFGYENCIVTSSQDDRSVRMWNVHTRTLLHKIDVAAVYWLGGVTEWSLCIGTHVINGTVSILDVAKPHVPTSDEDSNEFIVDRSKSGPPVIIRGHGGHQVTTVCISLSTFVVVSGSHDGRVCVWCSRTGRLMHTLKEKDWISCTAACVNRNGNLILTGTTYRVGSSKEVRPCITCWRLMWDPIPKQKNVERKQSMKIQTILRDFASEGLVHCLCFCQDNIRALSATSDYQIRIWNFGGGPNLGTMEMRYAGQPQEIERLGTSDGSDGMLNVFAEGKDGSFRKWNRRTGIRVVDKAGGSSAFSIIACSLTTTTIESGTGKGMGVLILDSSRRVSRWNVIEDVMETENVLNAEKEEKDTKVTFCSLAVWSKENSQGIKSLVWSKQKRLYLCSIHVHGNRSSKTKTQPIQTHQLIGMTDAISAIAISNNGRHIVAGSHEGELLWWDLQDPERTEKTDTLRIEPTRIIRTVDTESNGTIQSVHISKDNKRVVVVTWDEFFVYQFKGGRILGKRPIDEYFVTHAMCLDNGAILLIGDDRPRLWTLIPDEEPADDNESKASALKRWQTIKKSVRDNVKMYDAYAGAFAPKLSDECSTLAVNEPSQNMFVVGFCDGGICCWRRSSVQVFAKTTLPGGLPITAMAVNEQGTEIVAMSGTMAYRVLLGRPKCTIVMKIPIKNWMPSTKPMFLTRHPTSVVLHTTISQDATSMTATTTTTTTTKKRKETFHIDRGDRVDAWNIVKDVNDQPVVALGTKDGRVHILRRGGRVAIKAEHAYVRPPTPPKKEIVDLTLTGLLTSYHTLHNKERKEKNDNEQQNDNGINDNDERSERSERSEMYVMSIDTENQIILPDGEKFHKKEMTRWEQNQVKIRYWIIGYLRRQGLTIWPYNHHFPGVSKGLRPYRYRRLQKLQTKRNLKLIQLYILLFFVLLIIIVWLLVLVLYVFLLPPTRIISKIELPPPPVNMSNGTNVTAVVEVITCYDKGKITNQTQINYLESINMLCACKDYDKEKLCLEGEGLLVASNNECEWDKEKKECDDLVIKTCIDIPPSAGESW